MKPQKIKIFIEISFLLTIFLFSCGIPNIIYFEKPTATNAPNGSSDDSYSYFEFKTSDEGENNRTSPYFKGFEILYKIYESESDCKKDIESAKKENEKNPSGSAEYLENKLVFKFLSYEGASSRPLIERDRDDDNGKNRIVRFRLVPYGSGSDEADIKINGKILGKVKRSIGKDFSNISIDDKDVQKAAKDSSLNPDKYFVACFAVTYGINEDYTAIYSEILSLGYVKIESQ